MDEAAADGAPGPLGVRARHIKKRALKNKSLSVSFNEKDLKDYVCGFHKRKKKRRKEALQKQEEAERRKRIDRRKKRKLEREFVMSGGAPPDSGMDAAELEEEHELDEDSEPVGSVSGTMMYETEDVQVVVTTSEIAREEEHPVDKSEVGRTESVEAFENSKHRIPVTRKKQLKKATRKRSHPKPQSKRDKKKGRRKNKKP